MNGNKGTNFLYPSAIGQFRKQFAYLEENSGGSAPVIPLGRKHVSLPRSTVHSNTISHSMQPNSTLFDNRQVAEEASENFRGADAICGNASKISRPPPRVPTAKPGRVVGSVVPRENGRNIKHLYDARIFYRNAVLPSQTASHCFFRTNTMTREKCLIEKETSQTKQHPPQCNVEAKPAPVMAIEMNANPYYQAKPMVEQLNERIAIDAKLLQAQSQFGAVGAAAVAVAVHRNVGTVQYGLS